MVFLNKDPAEASIRWTEDQIQMYIVQEARRAGYIVSASMEQGRRSKSAGGRAKAMGMIAGMPDLNFWLPCGNLVCVELKTIRGRLSPKQKDIHESLLQYNYNVYTVFAKSPVDGWEQVRALLSEGKRK